MAAVKRNISLLDILHQIGMDDDTDFLREGAQLLTQRLIVCLAIEKFIVRQSKSA